MFLILPTIDELHRLLFPFYYLLYRFYFDKCTRNEVFLRSKLYHIDLNLSKFFETTFENEKQPRLRSIPVITWEENNVCFNAKVFKSEHVCKSREFRKFVQNIFAETHEAFKPKPVASIFENNKHYEGFCGILLIYEIILLPNNQTYWNFAMNFLL